MFPSTALDAIVEALRNYRDTYTDNGPLYQQLQEYGIVRVGSTVRIANCRNGETLVVTVDYAKKV